MQNLHTAAIIVLSVTACQLIDGGAALAEGKPKRQKTVAVLKFRQTGLNDQIASNIEEAIASAITKAGVFSVISANDIQNLLSLEQQKQMLGCDTTACMVELSGALGASHVVTGSVSLVEGKHDINLQLLEPVSAATVNRLTKTGLANYRAILEAAPAIVNELFAPLLKLEPAAVAPKINENGALFKIDDSAIGTTPIAIAEVPAGLHTLRLEKEGFIPFTKEYQFQPGETVPVEIFLRPSPEYVASRKTTAKAYRVLAWVSTALASVAVLGGGYAEYNAEVYQKNNHTVYQNYFEAPEKLRTDVRDPATAYRKLNDTKNNAQDFTLGAQIAFGSAAVLAGTALYFWLAGEDPGKYDQYILAGEKK